VAVLIAQLVLLLGVVTSAEKQMTAHTWKVGMALMPHPLATSCT
jgi:hypothetical protein